MGTWGNAEGLAGVGEGGTVIRLYCMKMKYVVKEILNFIMYLSILKKNWFYCMHFSFMWGCLWVYGDHRQFFSFGYEGPGDWT